MTSVFAIAQREYCSLFRTPLGWIVTALFLLLSGLVFVREGLTPGAPASMRSFFDVWWSLLAIVAPAISMRTLSEESRTGTLETLLTAPVSEWSVVIGKFTACVLFLITMLVPSAAYVMTIEVLSRPDYGPILAGYLGVVLLGMVYLSVGVLASSMTSSQTLAYLGALIGLFLMELVPRLAAPRAPETLRPLLFAISARERLGDFARGVIDTGNIVFFLVLSGWFVAMSAMALQSRRWR
jgi:ABC-2 type transport system permease protein